MRMKKVTSLQNLFCINRKYVNILWMFLQEDQYARWLAAMRLAAKGKSLADSSYESEVKSIQAFLAMQHPSAPQINPESLDIQAEDYMPPRYSRRIRSKVRFPWELLPFTKDPYLQLFNTFTSLCSFSCETSCCSIH